MWSPFGNGSGLHNSTTGAAGGGGGGGYVSKAQGWEFVPCSRLEREAAGGVGRRRSRSPRPSPRSPASPGARFFEASPTPPATAPASSPAACSDGQSPWRELQGQHARLKKKLEEMKRRHEQEKDDWLREKEVLLREMASIQGGENRRILLDLKSVLEEVQLEVKREEGKRSELQLQYTKDRCAWELERADLKCRIAQLEAKGHSSVVGTVKSSEGGDTLRRDREEQRRLLADTHTAAMDLRCRLEHSERSWMREKSELLERFDLERKEWENQLRDMQCKIEELYNEVKTHRKRGAVGPNADAQRGAIRLSSRSASTVSSSLTDPSEAQGSSYSEPLTQRSHSSTGSSHNHSELSDQHCRVQSGPSKQRSSGKFEHGELETINTAELEDMLQGCLSKVLDSTPTSTGQEDLLNPFRTFQSMDINCASDKKKNTMALNAALKEIARVSEELCSYQDEIRRKSDVKSRSESAFFPEQVEMSEELETVNADFSLNEWCKDLQALDKQKWINWEDIKKESSRTDDIKPLVKRRQAPPIPVRSTSWYLNSSPAKEVEASAPEPLIDRRCRSPCIHRKCNSPSIVRKFEAMLQENEGKILTDSGIVSCSVPLDSKCNISCCQSRWSCDGSRFGSSKSSTYVPVQKCFSDVNIAAAGAECSQNQIGVENKQNLNGEHLMDSTHRDIATDSAQSLDVTSPCINTKASLRNETLERKTAEFNRMLFQAGMGLRCNEDSFSSTDEHGTADSTTAIPLSYLEDNPTDMLADLMVQLPRDKCAETAAQTSPHLKSHTRNSISDLPPLQQNKESTLSAKKSFSRPACPAKRRLPSRWANRSSSTSSTSSPSPTAQPTISTPLQMFTYSAYHTETVIM
uniref:MTCL family member 3a n=1 Tax=Astyanax mexicanus TaxID=7994 RepID=A0A3B1IUR3_ASTMX